MKKKRVKRKNEKYYKSFPFKRGEFMSNTGINILILGKTGVGKSSFCNYIFYRIYNQTLRRNNILLTENQTHKS